MDNNDIYTNQELQDMAFTRGVRNGVISDLVANGTPSNTRELELLLGALKDSEDISVKSSRLRISSKKEEDNQDVNKALVAAMLMKVPSLAGDIGEGKYKEIQELPKSIEDKQTFVEGELDSMAPS